MIGTKYLFSPAEQAEFETFLAAHCREWEKDDVHRHYVKDSPALREYVNFNAIAQPGRFVSALDGGYFDVRRGKFHHSNFKLASHLSRIVEAIRDKAAKAGG